MDEIIKKLKKFRDDRDWAQFHNPKDLSIAISIEANELMELFLWKSKEDIELVELTSIKEEIADVLSFTLLLADHYNLDVSQIMSEKIEKNAIKYPIEKSKGNTTKYTKL